MIAVVILLHRLQSAVCGACENTTKDTIAAVIWHRDDVPFKRGYFVEAILRRLCEKGWTGQLLSALNFGGCWQLFKWFQLKSTHTFTVAVKRSLISLPKVTVSQQLLCSHLFLGDNNSYDFVPFSQSNIPVRSKCQHRKMCANQPLTLNWHVFSFNISSLSTFRWCSVMAIEWHQLHLDWFHKNLAFIILFFLPPGTNSPGKRG